MTRGIPQKLSSEGIDFLKKMKRNRIKADTDEEELPYWKLLEIMAKYFKLNNEEYLKLIKLPYGEKKNV